MLLCVATTIRVAMTRLKLSFLSVMLLISVSVFAGYAPGKVQAAFNKMYPTATDLAWSQDGGYYVAHFMMNGFDTKVWFNVNAQWAMKQTDWETMDQVPAEVFNTFAASDYADGTVLNVTWIEFPKWQSMVVVEIGHPNSMIKYQLLFAPDGAMLRARNVTYLYNILGASTFL